MIRKILHRLRLVLPARRLNAHLAAQNLALRQQLGMYARREKKPKFTQRDRLFWVVLHRLWPGWRRQCPHGRPEHGWRTELDQPLHDLEYDAV